MKCAINLTFLPKKLTALGLPPLWQQPISFGEVIPEFELTLKLSEHQPMEGFLDIGINPRANRGIDLFINLRESAACALDRRDSSEL